jgi:WhiB family redox-sensing transcriptional regulator
MPDQRERWQDRASCQHHDPSLWFPERGANVKTLEAKRICNGCSVKEPCLVAAVVKPQFGIWGGAGDRVHRFLRRLLRESPHPKDPAKRGCPCPYCATVADHWRRLEVLAETGRGPSPAMNTNGPGARHGQIATYKRGCDCKRCTKAGNPSAAA